MTHARRRPRRARFVAGAALLLVAPVWAGGSSTGLVPINEQTGDWEPAPGKIYSWSHAA